MLACDYVLTDGGRKEKWNFPVLDYPATVTNFERLKVEVASHEEHISHALSATRGTLLVKLLVSEINPKDFITKQSWEYLELYTRFRRYGINFLYPGGVHSIPNKHMWALDLLDAKFREAEAEPD